MNRNFSVGSVFDGFQGATSEQCTSGNYSGPFEFSEREVRNEVWVQTQFPNIKFANNIHSSGNLFMWPPGAYKPVTREPLPYPPYGTLNFFDQAAQQVLDGIKADRGTAILPQRTGPVIDVLYSAAGNSADNAYYNHGIIGYDFEIGTSQQPPIAEGRAQANEFANGNYGLLRSALQYSRRHHAAGRQRGRRLRGQGHLRGALHEQRGVVDLLHDRRLHADHGVDRVQAAARSRAAAAGRRGPGHDAQVDRPRLQGQHVRREVDGARADRRRPAAPAAPCRPRCR